MHYFENLFQNNVVNNSSPVRTRGVKSRICPLYPQRVVKGDLMGRFSK